MGLFKPKLNPEIQNKLNTLQPKAFISVPHIFGLPVVEGTFAQVYYTANEILIDAQGLTFHLSLSKIVTVGVQTSSDIQRAYVSSVGGAVLGGAILGPLGAAIGGRVKEKEKRENKSLLIFTYRKEEAVEQIAFDITYTPKGRDFVTLFQAENSTQANVSIEL